MSITPTRKPHANFWTPQEDELLRQLWPHADKQDVLKALPNRTWKSAMGHANVLGIRRYKCAFGDVWTTDELATLKRLWEENCPIEDVAELFTGKSQHAIRSMVTKHGFVRSERDYSRPAYFWVPEKVQRLTELYTHGESVKSIAALLGTTIPSVEWKAKILRLTEVRAKSATGYESLHPLDLCSEDAAYIAGFVDGEGSLILYKSGQSFGVRIDVYNTNKSVLEWMQGVTGVGSVCKNTKLIRRKVSYHWTIYGASDAGRLLLAILPHQRLKRKQGQMLLRYATELCLSTLQEKRDEVSVLYAQLKALNTRGGHADAGYDRTPYFSQQHDCSVTNEERSYMAGLFDGEGCVFVQTARVHTHLLNYRLSVVNTYKPVLEWFCDKAGCGTVRCGRSKRVENWKTCFVWTTRNASEAEKMLLFLSPFLKVKKPQAELALKYLVSVAGRVDDKVHLDALNIYNQHKSLNMRGEKSYIPTLFPRF